MIFWYWRTRKLQGGTNVTAPVLQMLDRFRTAPSMHDYFELKLGMLIALHYRLSAKACPKKEPSQETHPDTCAEIRNPASGYTRNLAWNAPLPQIRNTPILEIRNAPRLEIRNPPCLKIRNTPFLKYQTCHKPFPSKKHNPSQLRNLAWAQIPVSL